MEGYLGAAGELGKMKRHFVVIVAAIFTLTACSLFAHPSITKYVYNSSTENRIVHLKWLYAASGRENDWVTIPAQLLVSFGASEDPVVNGSADVYTPQCQLLGSLTFGRVDDLVVEVPQSGLPVLIASLPADSHYGGPYEDYLFDGHC